VRSPDSLPSAQSIEALLAHREWVRALARRLMGCDADVDDVEQMTWVAAMRQPRLAAGTLRAYLARIVRNLAHDRARERARRGRHERGAARPESTGSVVDTVVRAEAHRRVVETVLGLEDPYRTALLLRFFEGLPPRDIAQRLGCEVEAVRTRVRRGLEQMRERLGPRMELMLAPLLLPGLVRRTGIFALSLGKVAAVAAIAAVVGAGVLVGARGGAQEPARFERETAARSLGEAAPVPVEVAAPPSRPAGLFVSVWRPDTGAVPNARLLLVDAAGTVVAETATRRDGVGRFEPRDEETHALALVAGMPLACAAIPGGATEARIVLAPGASLEGSLLVDGAAPAQPVRLSVHWNGPAQELPEPLRQAVAALDLDAGGATCGTREDGTFRFEGLPVTEDAWIAVPPDFVLTTGGRSRRVSLPGPFIRLEALALPRLRGRVVFEGGTEGVPGALLHVAWTTGERSGRMALNAAPDGTFDLPLPELSLKDVRLAYADEWAVTCGHRALGAVGRGVHELGDLAVPALRDGCATLHVVDEEGRPVAGAVACAQGASASSLEEPEDEAMWDGVFVAQPFDPSGADGLIRLPVCTEPYFARIRAPGYEPRGCRIEAEGEATLVLTRSTCLSIRVETAEGDEPSGLVVVLSADRPLFPLVEEACEVAGFSECSSSEEGERYVWLLDGKAEARIQGLAAGLPFSVACVDAFGAVQASERVVLRKGEARDLPLRVAARAQPVRGVVRDAAGVPLGDVDVIGWAGEDWNRVACARTGADGQFVLEGARTPEVRLILLADSFQPLSLTVATDRAQELRLARGRRLRLHVADASGAPVREADVHVERGEFRDFPREFWRGTEVAPGFYVIDGLPAAEVTVTVRTRERTERFQCDARQPEADLTLGSN